MALFITKKMSKKNDEVRQKHLEENNLTVLRFTNDDIRLNREEVVAKIEKYLCLSA
jgi:very-short-patch-repair endonuclease